MSPSRPALFLDRDGVLNEPVWDPRTGTHESPLAPEDVRLVPGAAVLVRRAADQGLPVVVVSSQPAAAKGVVTLAQLAAVHDRVLALLHEAGADVDASYLCHHHPDGVVARLTLVCPCRKPAPGLLLQAADELDLDLARSFMVGDTEADVGAARAAGLAGIVVVLHPLTGHRRTPGFRADATVARVSEADGVLVTLRERLEPDPKVS